MEIVEIDKELEELEVKIDQLRGLYEQYFMGLEKLEPQVPRKDVEKRIKILRKEQIRNTAQRFKFNMLAQRINTLSQHWGRVVREIENGTYKRDVIRAAARFGDGALLGTGKKKAKLAAAAAAAAVQAKRSFEEAMELGADDLIEDDEEEDEVPTPPKFEQPAPISGYGLGPGDLPVVGGPPAPLPAVAVAVAPAPARAAGLRWGAAPAATPSDPASAIRPAAADVKRRVADLAAEMRVARTPQGGAGFGDLDLDFDDGRAQPTVTATGRPLPAAAPPPARAGSAGTRPLPAPAPLPVARAPQPQIGGFGVLDIPLDDHVPPAPAAIPAPTASSPGSGIRAGVGSAGRPTAPTPAARPVTPAQRPAQAPPASPAGAAPAGGDLGEQRIRQIYAKYVETKRSTQESTAGVTFEKLAATLRAQADKLKSAHPTKSIDYEVVVKDGKTHLKPVLR